MLGEPVKVTWMQAAKAGVEYNQGSAELRITYSSRVSQDVSEYVEGVFKKWLKQKLHGYVSERLNIWAQQMRLRPNGLVIKQFKRRWGSCDSKGVIAINTKLALVPLSCLDYVLVHELAHLKYFNHSPSFWALVERYQPDYQASKEELNLRHRVLSF